MPDSTPPPLATFKLVLSSAALPASDERWRAQVSGLLNELRRHGEVRKEITPVAGTKGGLEDIILALGTSGAITGAVAVFQSWLKRPGNPSIDIEGKVGRRKVKLKITGQNITEATVQQALTSLTD